MNPHFKPVLDCRNCREYLRFSSHCNKGHKLDDPKSATTCKDYRGNGSGSGNR